MPTKIKRRNREKNSVYSIMCVETYMYMYCVHVKFTLQYNGGNKDVYMPIYLYPESQGRNPFKVALSFPINNFRKNIF